MKKAATKTGNSITKYLIVISAVSIVFTMIANGVANEKLLVIFLFVVVIGAVLDSAWIKLTLAVFSLSFLIYSLSGGNMLQFKGLMSMALILIIMLFGFFVMIGGFTRK